MATNSGETLGEMLGSSIAAYLKTKQAKQGVVKGGIDIAQAQQSQNIGIPYVPPVPQVLPPNELSRQRSLSGLPPIMQEKTTVTPTGVSTSFTNLDTEDAIQRIRNLTTQKASTETKGRLEDLVNGIQSMDSLLDLVDVNREQFEKQFGPLKLSNFPGATGEFVRRLKSDPALSTMALEVESTFQTVRKAITGAQAGNKELEMLRPLTPDMRDPLPIFVAKTLAFRKSTFNSLQNRLKVAEKTGEDVKDISQSVNQTLAYSTQTYFQELLNAGVDPEQSKRLADTFSNKASIQAGRILRQQKIKTNTKNQSVLKKAGFDTNKYEIVS